MAFFPVIVCGGRKYSDGPFVFEVLGRLYREKGPLHIIEGGAPGADRLAFEWAQAQSLVRLSHVPADWITHGSAAGPIRNQQMLDDYRPELVVAFPGGRGTADMVRRARQARIEVLEVNRAASPDAGKEG